MTRAQFRPIISLLMEDETRLSKERRRWTGRVQVECETVRRKREILGGWGRESGRYDEGKKERWGGKNRIRNDEGEGRKEKT